MPFFHYQAKPQKCAIPYGKRLAGGRYKCWWCRREFSNRAAWSKHASGR